MKRSPADPKAGPPSDFQGNSPSFLNFPVQRRQAGRISGANEKLFYKIGEVSELTGLEPYIIRYWETEFPILRPRKSRGGQRIYLKKDVENILRIKQMLYEEGYTISGARRLLGRKSAGGNSRGLLVKVRTDLAEILRIVSSSADRKRSIH